MKNWHSIVLLSICFACLASARALAGEPAMRAGLLRLKTLASEGILDAREQTQTMLQTRKAIVQAGRENKRARELLEAALLEAGAATPTNIQMHLLAHMLQEDYAQTSKENFLSFAEKAMRSDRYGEYLKSKLLSLMANQLRVNAPYPDGTERIPKGIVYTNKELQPVFLAAVTPQSSPQLRRQALRFLMGDTFLFNNMDITILPIDEDAALQALKELVESDLPFEQKEPYWRMLYERNLDTEAYLDALKKYISDSKKLLYFRLQYARFLVEQGKLAPDILDALQEDGVPAVE